MKKSEILKRSAAVISASALLLTGSGISAGAAVIRPDEPNNYQNFAEALQLGLCFYDANKCGDEVAEDGYYS